MNNEAMATALQRAAHIFAQRLDAVSAGLDAVAERSQSILACPSGERPSRADLHALRDPVAKLIAESQQLVDGAGIAVGSGILADADSWLQWWRPQRDGRLEFTAHRFNPLSLNYYDYQAMNWFRIPVEAGEASVVGPYVDTGGTDLRIVTVTVPFAVGDGPRSVAAADLSLDCLERVLLRSLGTRDRDVVLLTDSGKIVASNTARHVTGTILDSGSVREEETLPILSARPARIPWRLALII